MSNADDSSKETKTDKQLLSGLEKGDEPAASSIYGRYAKRLWGFARKKLGRDVGRRVAPDDIVQSTFRTFFRRAGDGAYDVPDTGELWQLLQTIAGNKVKNQSVKHRAAKRDISKTADAQPETLDSVSDRGDDSELRMLIADLMSSMSERERSIVQLRIDGHQVGEIAKLTNSSKRTTERFLKHFRDALATHLDEIM